MADNKKISEKAGTWLGCIGLICAIVAFFWQELVMSIIGLVLGVIGLFSEKRNLNCVAVIVAAIALIVYFVK